MEQKDKITNSTEQVLSSDKTRNHFPGNVYYCKKWSFKSRTMGSWRCINGT